MSSSSLKNFQNKHEKMKSLVCDYLKTFGRDWLNINTAFLTIGLHFAHMKLMCCKCHRDNLAAPLVLTINIHENKLFPAT